MKKYYIYILTAVLPILWGACNNGDDIDTKHSIFSTEPMEHNGFDEWLLANYTYLGIAGIRSGKLSENP